jgi:hypothetical protein
MLNEEKSIEMISRFKQRNGNAEKHGNADDAEEAAEPTRIVFEDVHAPVHRQI